ncbi:DEAD/DEAH box helicase [Paractinoplanes maris]|uniref:DEAD/DEAH box helicase n=1 Tax=Paractinoplanes maris TaxID=1734446 RepID=UPI00201FD844|nr:DEAD/DEAH box helicase [Actinoplanes maris]
MSGPDRDPMQLWLRRLLTEKPDRTKRELRAELLRSGFPELTTRDVNRALYANRAVFVNDGETPPRWRVADPAALSRRIGPVLPAGYAGKEPRRWQQEALSAWMAAGRRGVVEAVTGTGKTTVGVLATAAAVDRGERVLVLVPGLDLLDQWYDVLQRDLRAVSVGRLGGDHEDSFHQYSVLVATVQTVARYEVLPEGMPGLLVADEVHRYGAEKFARALEEGFGARLGLTATYAREDNGLERCLAPYFGDVVAGCSYERGLADGILAPFRIAFVGTEFSAEEQSRYRDLNKATRELRDLLINVYGCPPEPFGEFMTAVNKLARGGHGDFRATMKAGRYLKAFNDRRKLLADCKSKYVALAGLAPLAHLSERGLIFGETTTCAEAVAVLMTRCGVPTRAISGETPGDERKQALASFRDGRLKMLAAPRMLDEGIDLPEAELAIVFAGTRSKRQMIQRMGRVIRPKEDGRPATLVVLYVAGTAEDPNRGAHEDFIEELVDVAEDVLDFRVGTTPGQVLAWATASR